MANSNMNFGSNTSILPVRRTRGRPPKNKKQAEAVLIATPTRREETFNLKRTAEDVSKETTVTVNKKAKTEKKTRKTSQIKKPKKEPKPKRAPKKVVKLPPEARIYLDDAMRGRVTRAMKQKMFVLSRELDSEDESVEKFEVLGSIGNNYTVSIGPRISCSCMDYRIRRRHCKHILMVLLKVYRLPFNSPLFLKLSTQKEERIMARSTGNVVDPSILVPLEVRNKILSLTYEGHPDVDPQEQAQRRPLETSDCPICFEEFEQEKIATIDFCMVCGNNIHQECFNMWKASKGSNVSCVYCRSKWVSPSSNTAGPSKRSLHALGADHINEGVANFAKELGITRQRDTSSYKTYRGYSFSNAGFDADDDDDDDNDI